MQKAHFSVLVHLVFVSLTYIHNKTYSAMYILVCAHACKHVCVYTSVSVCVYARAYMHVLLDIYLPNFRNTAFSFVSFVI